MAASDFLSNAPSLVGVFVIVAAVLYLIGAVAVGAVKDRGESPSSERDFVPPSENEHWR